MIYRVVKDGIALGIVRLRANGWFFWYAGTGQTAGPFKGESAARKALERMHARHSSPLSIVEVNAHTS